MFLRVDTHTHTYIYYHQPIIFKMILSYFEEFGVEKNIKTMIK